MRRHLHAIGQSIEIKPKYKVGDRLSHCIALQNEITIEKIISEKESYLYSHFENGKMNYNTAKIVHVDRSFFKKLNFNKFWNELNE